MWGTASGGREDSGKGTSPCPLEGLPEPLTIYMSGGTDASHTIWDCTVMKMGGTPGASLAGGQALTTCSESQPCHLPARTVTLLLQASVSITYSEGSGWRKGRTTWAGWLAVQHLQRGWLLLWCLKATQTHLYNLQFA